MQTALVVLAVLVSAQPLTACKARTSGSGLQSFSDVASTRDEGKGWTEVVCKSGLKFYLPTSIVNQVVTNPKLCTGAAALGEMPCGNGQVLRVPVNLKQSILAAANEDGEFCVGYTDPGVSVIGGEKYARLLEALFSNPLYFGVDALAAAQMTLTLEHGNLAFRGSDVVNDTR